MKLTSLPTQASARGERRTPTAASVSGQRSSTHSSSGARLSRRCSTAGSTEVMGDVWKTKIASKMRPRSFQAPTNRPLATKLR
jgi:hypothetical protein